MNEVTFNDLPQVVVELKEKICQMMEKLDQLTIAQPIDNHVPMSAQEAAQMLGKSMSTLYEFTSKQQIPFHKRGNKLYFFKDELLKWIEDGHVMDTVTTD